MAHVAVLFGPQESILNGMQSPIDLGQMNFYLLPNLPKTTKLLVLVNFEALRTTHTYPEFKTIGEGGNVDRQANKVLHLTAQLLLSGQIK